MMVNRDVAKTTTMSIWYFAGGYIMYQLQLLQFAS